MTSTQSDAIVGQQTPEGLDQTPLTGLEKCFPSDVGGKSVRQLLDSAPRLSAFSTPLLVLTDAALEHNLHTMAGWCAARGVELAPHGKTTMSPTLWARQVASGAWGISLATPSQVRVAVEFGIRRVQLANALVDRPLLTWLSQRLDADPGLQILSWVDSMQTVTAMEAILVDVAPQRPLSVLVELGAPGGRTGARSMELATELAAAISTSPHLRLVGVAGYEGAFAHDASDSSIAVVRAYLQDLAALHQALDAKGSYADVEEIVVSAGGSAYFDDVADVLGPLARANSDSDSGQRTAVVLRSGAYIIHDDGFYRSISPMARTPQEVPFRSAMHAWARVISRPEPGLALLDAGKRDVPFDEGLPEPQLYADDLGAPARELRGCRVTAVNDQHTFLQIDPDECGADLKVGQVVRLGLSHPCTAFDKWRFIPVIAGDDETDPVVVDIIQTFF